VGKEIFTIVGSIDMTDVIQKAISVLYEEFKNRDAMSSFNH